MTDFGSPIHLNTSNPLDWFSRLKMRQQGEQYRDPAISDYTHADDKLEVMAERNRLMPQRSNLLELAKKDYGEHLMTYTAKPIRFNASLIHEVQHAGTPANKEDDSDYDTDAASISSSVSENSADDHHRVAAKRRVNKAKAKATNSALALKKSIDSSGFKSDSHQSAKLYSKWKADNNAKKTAVKDLKQSPRFPRATGVRRKLEAALSSPSGKEGVKAEEVKATPHEKEDSAPRASGAWTEAAKVIKTFADSEIEASEKAAAEGATQSSIATLVGHAISQLGAHAKRYMITNKVVEALNIPKTPQMKGMIHKAIEVHKGKTPPEHTPDATKLALAAAGVKSYNDLQKAITKYYGHISVSKRKEMLDRYKVKKMEKQTKRKDVMEHGVESSMKDKSD